MKKKTPQQPQQPQPQPSHHPQVLQTHIDFFVIRQHLPFLKSQGAKGHIKEAVAVLDMKADKNAEIVIIANKTIWKNWWLEFGGGNFMIQFWLQLFFLKMGWMIVSFQGMVVSGTNTWKLILLMATRNPVNSPVEVKVSFIPLFTRFLYIPGGCLGFLNHQQDDNFGVQFKSSVFMMHEVLWWD